MIKFLVLAIALTLSACATTAHPMLFCAPATIEGHGKIFQGLVCADLKEFTERHAD